MIGFDVLENDQRWEIFEGHLRTVSIIPTNRRVSFLDAKMSEFRGLLLTVFPHFTLRPRHHFVGHYPQFMRMYGPLRDMWTTWFEGKHKFFKQVIHNTNNFKNIPQTLVVRHQRMMAYHVNSSSFFKTSIQMDKVTLSLVSSLETFRTCWNRGMHLRTLSL